MKKTTILLISIILTITLTTMVSAGATKTVYNETDLKDALANESIKTIIVENGTYKGNFIVQFGQTIKAKNLHKAILDGNGTGNVLNITSNNVTIEGLIVQNATRETYCSTGSKGTGIALHNVSNCTIENNIVKDNIIGVLVLAGSGNAKNNMIQGNTIKDNVKLKDALIRQQVDGGVDRGQGIRVRQASGFSVEGTHIDNNTISGSKEGLKFSRPAKLNVTNNKIFNNYYAGISMYVSHNNEFTGNHIYNNGIIGLLDDEDVNGTGINDTQQARNSVGVRIGGSQNNTFEKNKVYNEEDKGGIQVKGFRLYDSDETLPKGNKINYNKIYGHTEGDSPDKNYGLENKGYSTLDPEEAVIDATKNWWGHESGPGGEGNGQGNNVSENVDYVPWYVNEEMTKLGPVFNSNKTVYYETIQYAINNATEGDTIIVSAGTYEEQLTINKTLTIKGPNDNILGFNDRDDEAIIDVELNLSDVAIVKISADNVVFKGFTVRNGGTIYDGGVKGNAGILIQNASDVLVENNIVHGNAFGIAIISDNEEVEDNIIRGNLLYDNVYKNETGYIVAGNRGVKAGRGIMIDRFSGTNLVTGTIIENNHVNGSVDGIYLYAAYNTTIGTEGKGNVLYNNYHRGIHLIAGADNNETNSTIAYNIIYNNGIVGFTDIFNVSDKVIYNTTNSRNSAGIRISGAKYNIIQYNEIYNEEETGGLQNKGVRVAARNDSKDNRLMPVGNIVNFNKIYGHSEKVENVSLSYQYGVDNEGESYDEEGLDFVNATLNYWGTTSFLDINNSIRGNVSFMPICEDSGCTRFIDGEEYGVDNAEELFSLGLFISSDENITINSTRNITFSSRDGDEFSYRVNIDDATSITREDDLKLNISELNLDINFDRYDIGDRSADRAIRWGLEDDTLNFDPAITIELFVGENLNDATLDIRRSRTGKGEWITDGLVDTTCRVTDGYCTFETTKASYFVAIEQEEEEPTTGGGSATIITRTAPAPAPDDEVVDVVDDEVVDLVDDVDDEVVDDVDDEVVDEVVDDVDDEVVDDDVSPGFMTGLVTGFRPGEPLNIVGLVVLLGLLGVYVFYRSFTVAGLSKRSARLHKKADNLGKSGKYRSSIETRRKARRLQRRADEKGYGK